ncbi:MAG TPA: hypothetical protein VIY28_19585 [Pseudonocardiaceae bacterium]
MSVSRFQVVPAARYVHVPVSREPGPHAGAGPPRVAGFAWRFMSANNRSLARSAQTCPDVESCLAAIRTLQEHLPRTVGETTRNGNGQWVWRVRVADEVVATGARTYQRHVRARLMCNAFLEQVAETASSAPVQVIHQSAPSRPRWPA